MTKLDQLKNARTLTDLAKLLNYTPSGMSYIIYKISDHEKYETFQIPKKCKGTRTIQAPCAKLKRLQKIIGNMLCDCVIEIKKTHSNFWLASHGFQRKMHIARQKHDSRTILSNAKLHSQHRYVFNIDLENFFGTINFGRVRGFFMKNRLFKLEPCIATIIAQISCHDNVLPQGSPCSPIISNLIANNLDQQLLYLARTNQCTYTRYADDLTFSSRSKKFPQKIAEKNNTGEWKPSDELLNKINGSGFIINKNKIRMSYCNSRQIVTGLVVNQKPNVKSEYYKLVRSMCSELFKTGSYYLGNNKSTRLTGLNKIEGMLSHIYFIKENPHSRRGKAKQGKQSNKNTPRGSHIKLYEDFLYFKHFSTLNKPLIIPEGETDILYLSHILPKFCKEFPLLSENLEKPKLKVKFPKPTRITRHILNFTTGTGGQKKLIEKYTHLLTKFSTYQNEFPVIILCDNDSGAKEVFTAANQIRNQKDEEERETKMAAQKSAGGLKKTKGIEINLTSKESFYHLHSNLYLVKLPEACKEVCIENLFSENLLSKKINGKTFNPKNIKSSKDTYGKLVFAKQIVKKQSAKEDFEKFQKLFERLEECIKYHENQKTAAI